MDAAQPAAGALDLTTELYVRQVVINRERTLTRRDYCTLEQAPSASDAAQTLAAVIDLRGRSVSARKLAAAVGHSEGWVRARLALLTLPDTALGLRSEHR